VLRALLAAVLCAALAGACSGGKDSASETRAKQARQVAEDAGLPDDVQDLLAAAAGSAAHTFTVRYKLAVEGSTTITQDPPQRRIELVLGSGPTAVTRATITNSKGTFACTKNADAWTCRKTGDAAPSFSPLGLGDIKQTTAELAKARESYTFRVEKRTVAKTDAKCLVTSLRPGKVPDPTRGTKGVLCISEDGVPLVIEGANTVITATSYRSAVDPAAFRLPAAAS
jgi:hypothetical protein